MPTISVIGSSSMDLVVQTKKRSGVGETIIGDHFTTLPGGKGANQAVAASRLGVNVYMIGCVGDDFYGKQILNNFKKEKVNVQYVKIIEGVSSGTAHITVVEGDNSIIVVQGANAHVTPEIVKEAIPAIQKSDIVLIQQEIPEETVEYVCDLCEKENIPLVLNPAPARNVSTNVLTKATYLTPNEHEYSILLKGMSREDALKIFSNKLVITEGEKGVRYHNGEKEIIVPTFKVNVVDTTGAGDTFNGAFAVALSEGKNIREAVMFANRAASLSITKLGAQGGMPLREEVDRLLMNEA